MPTDNHQSLLDKVARTEGQISRAQVELHSAIAVGNRERLTELVDQLRLQLETAKSELDAMNQG